MNFCPNCGAKLAKTIIDKTNVKKCYECNYIDWNNYVNVSCVVVAFNDKNEFLMITLKEENQGRLLFQVGIVI